MTTAFEAMFKRLQDRNNQVNEREREDATENVWKAMVSTNQDLCAQ